MSGLMLFRASEIGGRALPRMGAPVRILDLARQMAHLSGLHPQVEGEPGTGDIEIRFTGLRPGEKLYGELLIGATSEPTEHPQIMRARETFVGGVPASPVAGGSDGRG